MQRRLRITLAITAVTGAVLAGAGTAAADDLGGLGGLLGNDDSSSSRYDSNGDYGSNYRDSNYGDSNSSDYGSRSDSSDYGSRSDSDNGSSSRGDSTRGSSSRGSSGSSSSGSRGGYGSSSDS
jgi:DNA helicase-2/ATP-dependent DNA helicase PcrA